MDSCTNGYLSKTESNGEFLVPNINDNECSLEINEVESLKSELQALEEKLKLTQNELVRVEKEKEAQRDQLINIEKKYKKFQNEKEKQSAALTETSRALQAALSERENLMEQEDRIRALVEEAEKAYQLCQEADQNEENESDEDDNAVLSESTIIFKAKLKEMKNKLRTATQNQTLLEEENSFLRDELKGARDSAQSLPSLRSELATSRSVSIEKEEECASLQAQLLKAEQTVQEVKAEILSLHDKLLEEQDAAAKHSYEAEQLRLLCKKQSLQIEVLKKSREEVRGKLLSTVKELEKCEKERASIEKELAHVNELIRRENERKAQKKAREEEENRRKIEARKRLEEEKAEREREGHSLQKPFEVAKSKIRKLIIPGAVVAVFAVAYLNFFAVPSPQHPF